MVVIWHEQYEKEIELSQNRRYLEFNKRNSPLVYKYDMADHTFLCYTRATGEPRQRHRGETNRWFSAKLVTEDQKLASMFKYAHALSGYSNTIREVMEKFADEKMIKFEQWAALGTQFRIGQVGWGSTRTPICINRQPSQFENGIRDFVASNIWTLTELNNFLERIYYAEEYNTNMSNINEIFKEVTESPEYLSDFIIIKNGEATNYLLESNIALSKISHIIDTYNLEIKRLLIYIHYLNNVECVNIKDILAKYPEYLKKELDHQNGHRNRMYKFPRYFISAVHLQKEKERRDAELENYNPEEQEFTNAYLEYGDDDYFIMIPRSPEDVRDEGRQQGHCVATRFMDYIATGNTAVVFMRRTNEPQRSLITIEIRDNTIRQACIGDNDSVPERYRNWIRNWASMKGVNITDRSWRTGLDY